MTNQIYGRLHDVFEDIRVVSLKGHSKIDYYYMPKGLFQTFLSYFIPGSYTFMTVSETKKKYKGLMVYSVESIEKIIYPRKQNPLIFYDISLIKSQIQNLITKECPKLFLDLEMSMPPYRFYQNFESEIIQYGLVITNPQGQIIEEKKSFVRPTKTAEISDRTKKFLKVSQEEIDQGISAKEFIEMLSSYFRKNRPMVFVWGQNDLIELRKACRINHQNDITMGVQIVDLLKLHKTYFGLKNDLGLQNAYNLYSTEPTLEKQAHDALEDALMTQFVFESFRQVTLGKRIVDTTLYK